MNEVYQVIEGYYFMGESQEIIFGTYSTMDKASHRLDVLIKTEKVDSKHTFIRSIKLDVDIND